ncbi:hypothetical protein LguiB_010426 [Lonicera macranthoides]
MLSLPYSLSQTKNSFFIPLISIDSSLKQNFGVTSRAMVPLSKKTKVSFTYFSLTI